MNACKTPISQERLSKTHQPGLLVRNSIIRGCLSEMPSTVAVCQEPINDDGLSKAHQPWLLVKKLTILAVYKTIYRPWLLKNPSTVTLCQEPTGHGWLLKTMTVSMVFVERILSKKGK